MHYRLFAGLMMLGTMMALGQLLTGCVGPKPVGQSVQPETMAAAPLPRYQDGTTFVYSDGTWEQVTGVEGGQVRWVSQQGNSSAGSADFIYPRSQWENASRKGTRRFVEERGLFGGGKSTLWPLALGNSASFVEYGETTGGTGISPANNYDNYYRCSVDGAEAVTVGAGTFDSWRITCIRYSDNSAAARKRPWEYRTWYYAPTINHWVLELRDFTSRSSEDKRKELVAVMPDLTGYTDSRGILLDIKRHFQDTLENSGSGKPVDYVATGENLQVTTTPVKTLRHPKGQVCRQYEQLIVANGRSDSYFGTACRETSGIWKVPRR